MSAIARRFASLKSKDEKALVLYVTAGDPSLEELPDILSCLADSGADLLEVGVPFSDPIADGPTIQASTQRALERGVTPPKVLEAISEFTSSNDTPVLLMGYYNPVLRRGLAQFASDARAASVSGLILSDLTPEESDPWLAASQGLDTVFLAAPTSTEARLDEVAKRSRGFLYAVSRTGVTGAGSEVSPEVRVLVAKLKSRTETPVCVGFGISKPEHVRMVCEVADGAVVGSRLVDMLSGGFSSSEVSEFVRQLKNATSE